MMKRIIAMTTVLLTGGGCATLKGSLLVGAGSGAAGGAVLGSVMSDQNKGSGALIGAAVGAAVGGVASYFIHKGLEGRDASTRKDTLFSLEKFGVSEVPSSSGSIPAISFRVVEEQKVETHRTGNKVIEGHRIWIISDDSSIYYNEGVSPEKAKK